MKRMYRSVVVSMALMALSSVAAAESEFLPGSDMAPVVMGTGWGTLLIDHDGRSEGMIVTAQDRRSISIHCGIHKAPNQPGMLIMAEFSPSTISVPVSVGDQTTALRGRMVDGDFLINMSDVPDEFMSSLASNPTATINGDGWSTSFELAGFSEAYSTLSNHCL